MSTKDITNNEPKAHHAASGLASPISKTPDLSQDYTSKFGGMRLTECETTPTQAGRTKVSPGESDSDGAATPTPSAAPLALPGSGLIRKSASSMALHVSADDDVFAPSASVESSSANQPHHLATSELVEAEMTVSERIKAGYLCIVPPSSYPNYAPRADRGTEVTIHNVQGMWPADAVVFVANLSAQRTQDQLEFACHNIFDMFGRNVIKVKFDKNKHPFALVQFETPDAAEEAIKNNQGAVLDGRTIRLEQGKAERAVIITKNNGAHVTEAETRAILAPYGALDAVFPTTALRGRPTNLPGFYVRFAFYQDCRDALKALSGVGSQYRLQLATGTEQDARQAVVPLPFVPHPRTTSRLGVHSNTDIKSIFVGNLPQGATKQDLVDLFAEHGQITDVNVITKRYEGGTVNIFGFVEYSSNGEADYAAYTEKWLGGKKLRIEPKEYTARRGNRISQAVIANTPIATPARSPRHTPRRITPQATNALSSRLAANNVENFGSVFTPGPTPPPHLLPANLFSPSPPNFWPMGGYGGGYYDGYGGGNGYLGGMGM